MIRTGITIPDGRLRGQRELQSPVVGGRDIRLDIWAQDGTGKHYNVEVQQRPEGAHIRRARFHSSMMDSRMLKAGQDFSELHDFACKESKDMYYPELAKGMKHFKEEGGRKKMCEAVEKYAKEYAKEYADRQMLNKQIEMIKNLMANMKLGAEQGTK